MIDEVFAEVLEYLIEAGKVKLEHYFVDGTKIEADAKKEFEEAFQFAINSPEPELSVAFEGMYAPEEGGK